MKIICPWCKAELDSKDDVPTTVMSVMKASYTCHKVICHNKDKHFNKTDVTVVFNPEEEKK